MRRQGPLTIVHMLVAALVVLVVNAQLTWWLVYALRENRLRLSLERAQLEATCAEAAHQVERVLDGARSSLLQALVQGRDPAAAPPPTPFADWGRTPSPCAPGWGLDGERARLTEAAPGGCVVAWLTPRLSSGLLELPAGLVLVPLAATTPEPTPALPGFDLPAPYQGLRVEPHPDRWGELLRGYRGRIRMVVSEGAFFAVLLLVVVALLAKTFRREVELERQHRNFLAAITHELKSPLAAMRLSLETVLRGRADGSASVRFLENALQDTERLQSLVQKVLEVTRYTGTVGGLNRSHSCLSEVVEESVTTFRRRTTAAGADLTTAVEPDVWAELDEEAFAIVVSNLLENAVKYGGTIPSVRVRLAASNGRAVLEVSDNGRGIPTEDLPFVFNRFFRGGDEMTRTTQGTGLGLFLVREIVTAHGGTVEVAATGHGGTTFRVTLDRVEVREV